MRTRQTKKRGVCPEFMEKGGCGTACYGEEWNGKGVWYGGFASKISIGKVRGRREAR